MKIPLSVVSDHDTTNIATQILQGNIVQIVEVLTQEYHAEYTVFIHKYLLTPIKLVTMYVPLGRTRYMALGDLAFLTIFGDFW